MRARIATLAFLVPCAVYLSCTATDSNVISAPPPLVIDYTPLCTAYVTFLLRDTIRVVSGPSSRYTIVALDSAPPYRVTDSILLWRPTYSDTGLHTFHLAIASDSARVVAILTVRVLVRMGAPQGCPAYTRKDNVPVGTAADLPEGFYVFDRDTIPGLYKSPLREFRPSLIPNTRHDIPRSIALSADGRWVFYVDSKTNAVYVMQSNGCHKTLVPRTGVVPGYFLPGGFYRESPCGQEIFYLADRQQIRALQVAFTDTGVVFGTDRPIALLSSLYLNPVYTTQYAVSGDQIFGAIGPLAADSSIVVRTGYLTIPDGGKGTATDADIYQWADDDYRITEGCGHTMSFDGCYTAANAGPWFYASGCIPTGHRGFYVAPFRRSDAPPLDIYSEHLLQYGTSLNWCPEQYRSGGYDFWGWYFTNDNRYVAGRMNNRRGNSYAWMVDWENNIWTPLCPTDSNVRIQQPAAHVGPLDTGVLYMDTACQCPDTAVVGPGNDSANPHYRVVRPNGGEVFRVNEPCTVQVTALRRGNAVLFLLLENGLYEVLLSTTGSFDPRRDSVFVFRVPDTFDMDGRRVSAISDSCKIRIVDYSFRVHYFDDSDSCFSIVP